MLSFNKLIEIISQANSYAALKMSPLELFLRSVGKDINVYDDVIVVKARVKYRSHQHYIYVYVRYDKDRNLLLIERVSAAPALARKDLERTSKLEEQTKRFRELKELLAKLPA
jgi:hypothetical protein